MSKHREMLLSLLGGKCEVCGCIERLELHHIDRNRKNNNVKNIKILCKVCHGKTRQKIIPHGRKVSIVLSDEVYKEVEDFKTNSHKEDEPIPTRTWAVETLLKMGVATKTKDG